MLRLVGDSEGWSWHKPGDSVIRDGFKQCNFKRGLAGNDTIEMVAALGSDAVRYDLGQPNFGARGRVTVKNLRYPETATDGLGATDTLISIGGLAVRATRPGSDEPFSANAFRTNNFSRLAGQRFFRRRVQWLDVRSTTRSERGLRRVYARACTGRDLAQAERRLTALAHRVTLSNIQGRAAGPGHGRLPQLAVGKLSRRSIQEDILWLRWHDHHYGRLASDEVRYDQGRQLRGTRPDVT